MACGTKITVLPVSTIAGTLTLSGTVWLGRLIPPKSICQKPCNPRCSVTGTDTSVSLSNAAMFAPPMVSSLSPGVVENLKLKSFSGSILLLFKFSTSVSPTMIEFFGNPTPTIPSAGQPDEPQKFCDKEDAAPNSWLAI